MTGYWLCNCLPSDVEAFAEAMDATVFTVVERVLGVSFDPSTTYGTDTNPVVADSLAELLRDPDPTAPEAATLSENAVVMARNGLNLPITRLKDELKDQVPKAYLSIPAFNVVTGSYDPRSLKFTLLGLKTMQYGAKYTVVPRATAVDGFERSLLGDIKRRLAVRVAAWHNTEP
eukprot:jgi/Tetstr1/466541/TSEL_011045.t1